jgi:predicted Zn-dependent protease
MVNVSLQPKHGRFEDLVLDTKDGVLVATDRSWSIDDLRLGFQFSCEIAWEIKNGKRGRILRDPVYTGMTPQFWRSCDAVCGREDWKLWGLSTCGKGDPMQIMHVAWHRRRAFATSSSEAGLMDGKALLDLCGDAREAGVARSSFARMGQARVCAISGRRARAAMEQTSELDHRVAHGKRVAEAQTSVLDLEGVVRCIRDADARAPRARDGRISGFAGAGERRPIYHAAKSTREATAQTRADLLAPAMDRVADRLPLGRVLETTLASACVATTTAARDRATRRSRAFASGPSRHRRPRAARSGTTCIAMSKLAIADRAERAVRFAKLGRDPQPIDAGSYDIVLEPARLPS